MTPPEVIREIVRSSRASQGLPAQVEDPEILRRVASLLAIRDEAPGHHAQGTRFTTVQPLARAERLDGTP